MAAQLSSFVALVVGVLLTPLTVCALGAAPQADPSPEALVPTAIERALIDRTCRATELSTQIDAHRQCLDGQLLSLRTDFGRDLGRLPAADRHRIDGACRRLSAAGQREAYLDCLSGQLVVLHNRKNRGNPAVAEETTAAVPAPAPEAVPARAAPNTNSWASTAMIAGTVGTVVCAAGFVFMSRRPRRTARPCRTCGVSVPDSDLCPTCRHEAAEALRHANAERVQHQKAEEEEGRRQRDYEAEQREQRAREAEEARVRELELARQAQAEQERADQNEAASVRVAVVDEDRAAATDRHADGTSAAPESDAFDPYAILRVSRDASADTIHAAYELARSKYDPDVVAHLGDEAQAHFKAKAEAVELAYQILSAGK